MTGRTLGVVTLRLDAGYCLLLGLAFLFAAPYVADVIPLPVTAIAILGGAVIAWSAAVIWMVARLPLHRALRVVLIANLAAALAMAGISLTAPGFLAVFALVAIAVDVAAFAGVQAIALARLRTASRA